MRVRRVIHRQIELEVASVLVQAFAQSRASRGPQPFPRQVINPDPRKRPKRDLECAGPVNPATKWILFEPAFELRANFSQEFFPPTQLVGLRQHDQVLMTIQLPDNLVITGARRVHERKSPKIMRRRFAVADRIATPLSDRSSVNRVTK